MRQLRDNQGCYVCGANNPSGLGVVFHVDSEAKTIRGRFTPSPAYQGFEGIVHGGILSTLLDEAMVKLAFSLGLPAVSVEITVSFKSPAAPGDELAITGRLTQEHRRLIEAEAKIEHNAVLIAEAKGKLLKI